jgi:ankyrin repeat protein
MALNLCDTDGYTPLHAACIEGHTDIVNILLKCNSSVNLCGTDEHVKEYIHRYHIDLHYYYTSVKC